VQGAHAADLRQFLRCGLARRYLRRSGVEEAVQVIGRISGDDGVVIDEVGQWKRPIAGSEGCYPDSLRGLDLPERGGKHVSR